MQWPFLAPYGKTIPAGGVADMRAGCWMTVVCILRADGFASAVHDGHCNGGWAARKLHDCSGAAERRPGAVQTWTDIIASMRNAGQWQGNQSGRKQPKFSTRENYWLSQGIGLGTDRGVTLIRRLCNNNFKPARRGEVQHPCQRA